MRRFMTVSIASLATIGALAVQAPAAHAATSNQRIGTGSVLRAVMYEHANFGGAKLEYYGTSSCSSSTSDTDYRRSTLPAGWNDRISSWKDFAGCDVKFYMDSNFGGRYTYYLNAGSAGRNLSSEWNDQVSSFKVS